MSAFGHIWKDIDDTKSGAPYVVDSDGWGWFFIFMILILPIFILGLILNKMANIICQYIYFITGVYLILSTIMGIVFYKKNINKYRFFGAIATIITLLPFLIVELLYAIPYVMIQGLFSAVFEFFCATAVILGVTFFILSIAKLIQNGILHFFIASVFLVITVIIMKNMILSSDIITLETLKNLYQY